MKNESQSNRLEQLRAEHRSRTDEHVFSAFMAEALLSAVEPFGLAPLLADDKNGGNVTTLRASTAGDKRYMREKDQYHSEIRSTRYQSRQLEKNRHAYINPRRREDLTCVDEYTGKTIPLGKESLEHIVPIQLIHARGGYMLSAEKQADAAADVRNFAVIDRSANSSKGGREYIEWRDKRGADGRSNKVRYGLDERRTKAAVRRGEAAIAEHLPNAREQVQWYAGELARTGVETAGRIGLQQALGLILREFISAAFAEVKDVWRNGILLEDERLPRRALLKRMRRVAERVLSRWKDVVAAGVIGGLRGFFSNIIATVINMVVATPKRVVRLLREGGSSLFKAAKVIACPEPGTTTADRAHAATQIVAAGAGVAVGVLVEEFAEQALRSTVVLAPFASSLALAAAAFVGSLASAVFTVMVEQLDPYGVVREKENVVLQAEISERCNQHRAEIWALIDTM